MTSFPSGSQLHIEIKICNFIRVCHKTANALIVMLQRTFSFCLSSSITDLRNKLKYKC